MKSSKFKTLRGIAVANCHACNLGDPDSYYKDFHEYFIDFCSCVGIDLKSLQAANRRYQFPSESEPFVIEVVDTRTVPPVSYLRNGDYDKVPFLFYGKTEKFIKTVMTACEKNDYVIHQQLVAFRHKTKWLYKYDIDQMKIQVIRQSDAFFMRTVNTGLLGNDDRLLMFLNARLEFRDIVNGFFKRWRSIAYDFKAIRSDEIADIDTEDNRLELIALEIQANDELEYACENDSELAGWSCKLEDLQKKKSIGNQEQIDRLSKRIDDRTEYHRSVVCKKLGITPEIREQIGQASSCKRRSQDILSEILGRSCQV